MDFLQNLTLFIIIILVLVVLPTVLARRSGKSPLEMLFGRRGRRTLVSRNDPDSEDETGSNRKSRSNGNKNGKDSSGFRNSNKKDLYSFVSDIVSYSRRNRFYCLVPGTLEVVGEIATFAVIIVTRGEVIGFNCFGYGGTVYCRGDEQQWKQELNGKEAYFDSPTARNKHQDELLAKALGQCGYANVRSRVFGVFTAPKVELKNRSGTGCYTDQEMKTLLREDEFLKTRSVETEKVGKALEEMVKRAEKKENKKG